MVNHMCDVISKWYVDGSVEINWTNLGPQLYDLVVRMLERQSHSKIMKSKKCLSLNGL